MTPRRLTQFCRSSLIILACASPALFALPVHAAPQTADDGVATLPVPTVPPLTPAPATSAPAAATPVTVPASPHLENAVVKIFSTIRAPDPFRPWNKATPVEVSGSGVVIEGNRILTNAHVVGYASQVQVQAKQGGDKISATVVAIARGIDLAVLKLDDESFFASHKPPVRANVLPDIKDAVLAYGYPTGGTSLSITKGIVSRIEFVPYNYQTSGLRIQIDAAINPGNSGGPVIAGDKMIGLAFSGAINTQNIGYIIPNEEIELFLKDIADGRYDGKPAMFDALQTLENPVLRTYLKLDKSVHGMVVQHPAQSSASYPLKEWDVVTQIGEFPVDNQGMVKLNADLNVRFQYRIQQLAKDGKLPLTLIRNGKTMTIQLPVSATRPQLVPPLLGSYPSYFVAGPIVFSRASLEFRALIANNPVALNAYAYNNSPLVTQLGDEPSAEREELVVVSAPFFPHKLVKGYDNRFGSVLYSVNGTPVRSLKHLVTLLRDSKDELIVLKFDQRIGENIVLPRKELMAATDEILTDNGIRSQGSQDMMDVWQGKAGK
ncbi:trypsin-like peptidase domain-containing protein [Undibacterium sp. TJN25]|uniref:S1C family serine protease n=1 Tax=Undibacterium sp. TJN25 TaxID=3413056 RepID=UPI003BEF85DC